MDSTHTVKSAASYCLALSLLSLALALGYFSYSLHHLVTELPKSLQQLERTADSLQPLITEVGKIAAITPQLLQEVEAIEQQIPKVLSEVAEVRALIPSILTEVSASRAAIPPVLAESEQWRALVPDLVTESQGYRTLTPAVLEEVAATRAMVPDTLADVSELIDKAGLAGKEASEGAVAGVITGFIKMPLALVNNLSKSIFNSKEINNQDRELLTQAAHRVINADKVGASQSWYNKRSEHGGEVTLIDEVIEGGRRCRVLEITARKGKKLIEQQEIEACFDDQTGWTLKSQS